jgi:hypothetical protein
MIEMDGISIYEEREGIVPYLYMEKMRWKRYKRFTRENGVRDEHMDKIKEMKWRVRFHQRKKGRVMGPSNLFEIYKRANEEAVNMLLHANYEEELLDWEKSEWVHEGR